MSILLKQIQGVSSNEALLNDKSSKAQKTPTTASSIFDELFDSSDFQVYHY